MTFIINEAGIKVHRRPNGQCVARYIHPTIPTRMGLANWVVAQADTFHDAHWKLIVTLEDMGGVRTKAVVQ